MTPNLTPEHLAALREAAGKATKGEWHIEPVSPPEIYSHPPGERHGSICEIWSGHIWGEDRGEDDAAYIVAAQPRAVLALLDRIEALEARATAAEAEAERLRGALEGIAANTAATWVADAARAALAPKEKNDG